MNSLLRSIHGVFIPMGQTHAAPPKQRTRRAPRLRRLRGPFLYEFLIWATRNNR